MKVSLYIILACFLAIVLVGNDKNKKPTSKPTVAEQQRIHYNQKQEEIRQNELEEARKEQLYREKMAESAKQWEKAAAEIILANEARKRQEAIQSSSSYNFNSYSASTIDDAGHYKWLTTPGLKDTVQHYTSEKPHFEEIYFYEGSTTTNNVDYYYNSTSGGTNPSHVNVQGYYREDGTYVKPYTRTAPNPTIKDNFSFKGNVNPYTGKVGSKRNR